MTWSGGLRRDRARHSRAEGPRPTGGRALTWWSLLAALLASAGCGSEPPAVLDLAPRPPDAEGGRALAEQLAPLDLAAREERIYREVAAGNVPASLRTLVPVRMRRDLDGTSHEVELRVTADYLSIGSDEDFLLVPLSPGTAQRIADLLGASLPTPRMVDAIWAAADVRLSPQRLAPTDSVESVRTVEYFERHTSVINGQRMLRGVEPGELLAGHKKDVVISTVVAQNPGKVAVYGMHMTNGVPTQELSTVAEADWVYYNHGVRLVDRRIRIDGVEHDLAAVLRDPSLAPLLSDEGPIEQPRYPTGTEEPTS